MRYGTVIAAGLVFLVAGCGAGSSAVPEQNDPRLVDCGSHTLGQGERMSSEVASCFLDAIKQGLPARLKQTFLTTEGDPITVAYESRGDDRVYVKTDSTKDEFGSEKVSSQVCTGPKQSYVALDFRTCTPG